MSIEFYATFEKKIKSYHHDMVNCSFQQHTHIGSMGDDETVTIETTEVDPENIEETVTVSSDLDGKHGEIGVVCYLNEGGFCLEVLDMNE